MIVWPDSFESLLQISFVRIKTTVVQQVGDHERSADVEVLLALLEGRDLGDQLLAQLHG